MTEEELDIDDGIFENKEAVVENIKSAAENVGMSQEVIDRIDTDDPKKVYYAKKHCDWCFGRGMLDFAANGVFVPTRKKEPSKALLKAVKTTRSKLSKHVQRLLLLTNGACRPGRDTRLPEEPKRGEWWKENMSKVLCKCVRILEED